MSECKWCGNPVMLETHHIIPRFIGGDNDPVNLLCLCRNCHDIADIWNYADLDRYQASPISYKNIRISEETHAKLLKLGRYRESLDDIIVRLIEGYSEK